MFQVCVCVWGGGGGGGGVWCSLKWFYCKCGSYFNGVT